MSALLTMFGVGKQAGKPDALDDFWYRPVNRATSAGVDVDEISANNYSAVWAATRLLTATGSCLPFNVFEQLTEDEKSVARDHPLQRTLKHEPNAEMGSMAFRSLMLDWQINWGNAYAEIVRQPDGSIELWPIHPSRVEICRTEMGELFYSVKSPGGGDTTDILSRDMFHVRSVKSYNGIEGVGVIEHARESIGMGLAVERQGAAYFKNGGRPLVVIKDGKFKDNDAREYFRSQWSGVHGGPDNNGKPALLPMGADIATLQFSAEDSQFLQTREHNVEVIARWYGVPPHMVGDLRRATFSNIEHMAIEFVVYSLVPWLKMWEEEAWRKLLSLDEQRDHFTKHNVDGLLRGDTAARAAFYTALFNIGVLSVNDIRKKEDMNPVDGGDKHFVPLNMSTLDGEDMAGNDGGNSFTEEETERVAKELCAYLENMTVEQVEAHYSRVESLVSEINTKRETVIETDTQTALAWFKEATGRMRRKEANDVKRAAKREANFVAWLDSYYEKFETQLCDAIAGPCESLETEAATEAATHCERYKAKLLACADGDREGFVARVETEIESWGLK